MVVPEDDDDDAFNPGGLAPEMDDEEDATEQLHAFLADAWRLLQAADASGEALHALIPCAHSAVDASSAFARLGRSRLTRAAGVVALAARAGRCPSLWRRAARARSRSSSANS